MKKIVSLMLILTMLFTNNVFAEPKTISNIKVAYIEDVRKGGSNLNTDIIDNYENEVSSFDIKTVTFDNNELLLQGSVMGKAFNLFGVPKLKNYNGNVIYFESNDLLDNYTVLNISLEKGIEESAFYHKGFAKNKIYDNVLKVYLQPLNTNDIVVIEYFNSPVSSIFSISDAIASEYDENSDLKLKYWYGRIFEPVVSTVISPNGLDNNIGTYTYEFNHLGATYYHHLVIQRIIEWPTNVTDSGSNFNTQLFVDRNYVTSEYGNEMSDMSSYYEIDEVAMEIAVDSGDGIHSVDTDGEVYNSSSTRLTFSFNELPIGSIGSIGVNYTSGEAHFDINSTMHTYQNGPDEFIKEARIEMPSASKLKVDGNYFSADWVVKNFNGLNNGTQTFKVKFYYYITNLWVSAE
nr:hypothetical protein [Sedimentibacter sp.]